MTVLRVTVPDQYFCTKHPDLNITAQEKKVKQGQVSLLMEKYSPLGVGPPHCIHLGGGDRHMPCSPFSSKCTLDQFLGLYRCVIQAFSTLHNAFCVWEATFNSSLPMWEREGHLNQLHQLERRLQQLISRDLEHISPPGSSVPSCQNHNIWTLWHTTFQKKTVNIMAL